MFLGALLGAQLVLHGHLAAALGLATLLLLVTTVVTYRLAAPHAPWAPPA
jgi:hypothetical protein